jgi:cyclopropane-fatty-acyl-phospholipid synthase
MSNRRFSLHAAKTDWLDHWNKLDDSGNRSNKADYLTIKASEVVRLLGDHPGEQKVLDLGCGAGELLAYYAPHVRQVRGVDFSASMIQQARVNLDGVENVRLEVGDALNLDANASEIYDSIVSFGAIGQYATDDQLLTFFKGCKLHFPRTKIVVGDSPHPEVFPLLRARVFSVGAKSSRRRLSSLIAAGMLVLRAVSPSGTKYTQAVPCVGFVRHPDFFRDAATKAGYDCSIQWSALLEYRYHAVLTPTQP